MQVKGDIHGWWGKITENDVAQIQGDAEKMIGMLQQRYGYTREKAEQELTEFLNGPEGQRRHIA